MGTVFAVFAVAIVLLSLASIRIIKEHERGIVYMLGTYSGTRKPGIQVIIPFIQKMEIINVGSQGEIIDWTDYTGTIKIKDQIWQIKSLSSASYRSGDIINFRNNTDIILTIRKD